MVLASCLDNKDAAINPSQQEMEQRLVGLWQEEFEYEDVTEEGKPFNRALIVMEAKDDHTGYIALAVFDDEFNEPLKIYGGPKDAPFTISGQPDDKLDHKSCSYTRCRRAGRR